MAIAWTPSQRAAIDTRGRNILVSAAAGSGKTAVLVERIIKRVMHDRDKTDIDRMLIVTFTNAAAAEMKEKIDKRLRGYEREYVLSDGKYSGRCRLRRLKSRAAKLQRRKHEQLSALDDASICTIDSFCNDCVRSFTHELNISPDFRLCDPAEDSIIIESAADALIEECYNTHDACFDELSKYYGSMRGDGELKGLIIRIYSFLQSYAEPLEKLDELFRHYDNSCDDTLFETVWASELISAQKSAALRVYARFDKYRAELESSCSSNAEAYMLESVIKPCMETLGKIIAVDENGGKEAWDAVYNDSLAFEKYPPKKPVKSKKYEDDYDKLKEIQEAYDELMKGHDFSYVVQNSDEAAAQFEHIEKQAKNIRDMVVRLSYKADEVKHRRSVYSFADIEHMTYRLITYPEYAEAAAIYKERYTDILIDEYQDTNGLQDAIFAGISDGKNVFMVGDLKQSIYAFRGGDPSIFKKKGAEYIPYTKADKTGAEPVRIDLSDNFRSNIRVVSAVNELFGYVMTDELGDVDYDRDGERLRCGRELFDTDEMKAAYADTKSEIVYLPLAEDGQENGEAVGMIGVEARYVAQRIRDMVDSRVQVIADGEVRDIRYGDFTIIANSVSTITNIYSDALAEKGIPLGIPAIGYYDFFEISVVLSFLRIIANRRRDVPLVTVMRSPIGGFTDEELADIAMAVREPDFYGRMQSIVRISRAKLKRGEIDLPVERALLHKIEKFISLIDRFDSYKHYRTVAAIVYAIYTETGFYDFVGAMDGGRRAQQNLTLLYEKARRFETAGTAGLYSFVKYIDRLRADADKEEGAAASDELQNAVRMMTIHGSKGLEFPVVFMVSCGKAFMKEAASDGLLNREAGIGLRYLDSERKLRTDSPIYRWVRMRNKREARSEDVRKLYVGVTRARERLICLMSGRESMEDMTEAQLERADALARDKANGTNTADLVNARGFMGWIMPAYLAGAEEKGKASPWYFDNGIDTGRYLSKDVFSIIRHRYRFDALTALPSKTTVSKVKEEYNREEQPVQNMRSSAYAPRYSTGLERLPSAQESAKIAANVMGTAYHKVMELIDPMRSADIGEIKEQIEGFCAAGQLDRSAADEIEPVYIANFYNSEMGERIKAAHRAGRLHRETPFEIAITPDEYEDTAAEYTLQDRVLLQGTIDCWFEEEDGGCVVIDYKTDSYKGAADDEAAKAEFAEEKAREYGIQLELYSKALELAIDDGTRINSAVKEKYIYLFKTNSFKKVNGEDVR